MAEYLLSAQNPELRDRLAFVGPVFLALENKELGRNKGINKNTLEKSDD